MEPTIRVVTALERLKGPFLEAPATRLSLADATLIAGVDPDVCRLLLSALVDVRFLTCGPDGSYSRPADLAGSGD
jgi:hypothetical protein